MKDGNAQSIEVKVVFAECCDISESDVLVKALRAVIEGIREPFLASRLERCAMDLTARDDTARDDTARDDTARDDTAGDLTARDLPGPGRSTGSIKLVKEACLDLCAELFSLADHLRNEEVLGSFAIEAVGHRVLDAIVACSAPERVRQL